MLTSEEFTFLVEWAFRAGNKCIEIVKQNFSEIFQIAIVLHRDSVRGLIRKLKKHRLSGRRRKKR